MNVKESRVMKDHCDIRSASGALAALAGLVMGLILPIGVTPAQAQQRFLLPEGTVFTVRTETALGSRTSRQGETFRTTVTDSVRVEGFTVIPEGSTIVGTVTLVRPASQNESGVLGVEFTRLDLRGGGSVAIDGKLTSTDPAERRQIEAQGDARVVFVGGRQGPGAAVGSIGRGTGDDPVAGILGAIGALLSEGADVTVAAGTPLAVQLERGLALTGVGTPARSPDAFTIYTSTTMIQAAQEALRGRGYYRGPIDGRLTDETQRALVAFQIDEGILVTGNLDGRTAQTLALTLPGGALGLTAQEAGLVRRNAQLLTVRWRDAMGVSASGRLDPRRLYEPGEIEMYFALSAFTDNAGLYEQMVRLSGHAEGIESAGRALIGAAGRVDGALRQVEVSPRFQATWSSIQDELSTLDPAYRG
jgi:peptidoglycan hydrolase-like protein with peptidoglycan-binding domain